jgi:hypothetical protein
MSLYGMILYYCVVRCFHCYYCCTHLLLYVACDIIMMYIMMYCIVFHILVVLIVDGCDCIEKL